MSDETPLDLDAIRARAETATPGPWGVGDGGDYFEWEVVIAPHLPPLELSESADGAEDAEFIAHARTDIPALLAEVDRLRAELAEAEERGYKHGRIEACEAVLSLPAYLGDEGWSAIEQDAADAGWSPEAVRRRRTRDDFTTLTIEAAYQHARKRAVSLAGRRPTP